MKPAILHAEAEAELREALGYYAGQRAGLDGEFRRDFETALERICNNPRLFAEEDGTRRCPLRRFPYTLVYIDLQDCVWIAAVAHQRRRPRYWAYRQLE